MLPLAFVDLETTGATAGQDRITEIGIVEVDADGSVREWQQLVDPGMPIPPFVARLTGIDDALVAGAPPFAAIADEVLRRLSGRLFIAHNARFDYGFLKHEFQRLDIGFRADTVCTVKLSRALYPEHRRHNLDSLIERHGLHADARHRALADAQLIHQFWEKIHAAHGADAIAAALAGQNPHPALPAHIDPETVDALPETPGIYLFHGEDGALLYIGKAKDIRRRVLSHFSARARSPREAALAEAVHRIDWVATAGEIGAALREAALLARWRPAHNRPSRPNETPCTWILAEDGDGWLRPRLALAADLAFDIHTACYGLFKHQREAAAVLRQLTERHQLCDLAGDRTPGRPCPAYAERRCKGACVGKEAPAQHAMRLLAALSGLKLLSWPFHGPALLREGDEAHLVDGWRYLGSPRSAEEADDILHRPRPSFDRDIYKILARHANRMTPWPGRFPSA